MVLPRVLTCCMLKRPIDQVCPNPEIMEDLPTLDTSQTQVGAFPEAVLAPRLDRGSATEDEGSKSRRLLASSRARSSSGSPHLVWFKSHRHTWNRASRRAAASPASIAAAVKVNLATTREGV